MDDRAIEVRSPTGAEDFSSSPCVQTGSGAHPASYPMGTGGSFPGGKARPGRDADHSPPSCAEVKGTGRQGSERARERATKKDRTYVLLSNWPYWRERVSDVAERASDIALQ
jgi:hypothetical protein